LHEQVVQLAAFNNCCSVCVQLLSCPISYYCKHFKRY